MFHYENSIHDFFTTKQLQPYWEFSFNEIFEYDGSAMVDYVLKSSKYPSLSFVAHGAGAWPILTLLSSRKDYDELIRPVVLLAPLEYYEPPVAPSLRKRLVPRLIKQRHVVLNNTNFWKQLTSLGCNGLAAPACVQLVQIVLGSNAHLDWRRLDVYAAHFPAGERFFA